jgi:hypothetical protein
MDFWLNGVLAEELKTFRPKTERGPFLWNRNFYKKVTQSSKMNLKGEHEELPNMSWPVAFYTYFIYALLMFVSAFPF